MCILKRMKQFAVNGTRVLGKASKGQFQSESEVVKQIKKELMSGRTGRRNDMENLMRDRRNIESDIRKSFNKLVVRNG